MRSSECKYFTCKYGNEPADLKLLLIYLIQRIRFVAYFVIFGALIFASVYYLKTFVLVEEHEYVATGELYLVYNDDVRLESVYINDYTWQTLVHTDKVIEYAMSHISSNVTEEELKAAVTAGLVSDVRFVALKVTTNNPELSVEIAQAFQLAIIEMAEEMVDIDSITVFTEADSAEQITTDNRTVRMACTGAVIGFVLSFMGIILQYIFDDSIYAAGQFERRFGIPVIGICLHTKAKDASRENKIGQKKELESSRLWGRQAIKLNYNTFTKGCKKIAVTDTSLKGKTEIPYEILKDAKEKLEQDELLAIAMGDVQEGEEFYTAGDYSMFKTDSINKNALVAEECAKADGVILMVRMGAHNGKLLERAIDLLSKQGCNILGALLYDGDASLLKMYYYEPLLFGSKERKESEEDIYQQEDFDLL